MDYSVFRNFYVYRQGDGIKQANYTGKALLLPSGRPTVVEDNPQNPQYLYTVLKEEDVMYLSTGSVDRVVIDNDIVILTNGVILLTKFDSDNITLVKLNGEGNVHSETMSLYEYDLMLSETDNTDGLPAIKWNAELQKYEFEQWLKENFCKVCKVKETEQ